MRLKVPSRSRSALLPYTAALVLGAAVPCVAASAAEPYGVWINDTGRGAIEIKRCGNNLCGHVVWVKDPKDTKGCGKQIIGDAAPVGRGVWDGGWIYSPERHKTFDVEVKPLSNGTLQVTGYAGVRFLSKTMIWTRAPSDLQRCDASSITAQTETKPAPAAAPAAATAAKPAEPAASAKTDTAAAAPGPSATSSAAPAAASTTPAPAATPSDSARAATPPAASEPAQAAQSTTTPSDTKPADETAEAKAGAPTDEPEADEPKAGEAKAEEPKVAEADGEDDAPPPHKKSRLKLGDLNLDKVLTRTKSGRCKLDLPFVKVQFDCDRD